MEYRRIFIPGGTCFFTVNLADRASRLLVECVDALRDVVRDVRQRHPFEVVAWVVLPDHIHSTWALPPDDANFPVRWALIKAGFSRRVAVGEHIGASRRKKGERGIWQRCFWEHLIRDENDLVRHVDYVHVNPVKHGHAAACLALKFNELVPSPSGVRGDVCELPVAVRADSNARGRKPRAGLLGERWTRERSNGGA